MADAGDGWVGRTHTLSHPHALGVLPSDGVGLNKP
jgi:hypothetical protein